MRKVLVLFFSLLVFNSVFSQDAKKLIYKAFGSKDSSDYYFKLAKKNIKTPADEAEYYFGKNARCNDYNQPDSCVFYGLIAIQKFKKIGNINSQYYVFNNIAASYRKQGQYEKAISYILDGLKIAESENKEYWLANYNTNISLNYHDFESYSKGVYYGKKALNYGLKAKKRDEKSIAFALNAIAISFDDWNKPDSALFYHKKVFNYVKGKDTLDYSHTYNNIGNTYMKQKKYKEAESWIKRAMIIGATNSNGVKDASYYYENATHYTNLATIAYNLDDFAKAETLFDKAYFYVKNSKSAEKFRDYFQQRYLFNMKRKNLEKTVEFQENYIKLRDSVFEIERAKTVTELETKYQTEKKEKLLLEKEAEAKQKNTLILGISILAFFIALIGYLIYRQQKLKATQQVQEFELKSAISKIENQNKLQEQRLNISRDLHDNIGAQLTFIISSVDNIKYAFDITNEKLDSKLSNISSFAKETIVELRDTIWAMNSNEISFEDLEIRINNYIEKAKEAKDQISFSFAIDSVLKTQKLTSVQGMNIYRTIQEAVNNSIKYANASVISINAKQVENQLKIIIQDNGLGFDEATVEKGNGLKNMQKRIEEIGGGFHLSSSNEGTRIEILI
ncbi:MAG: sensor histidine kinase [Flavobacteriaceae bacterium]|nr:sensor histidine kinase [Flavobacteriaceae bacterium]